MKNQILFYSSILVLTMSCTSKKSDLDFELLPSSKTGITFSNDIVETKDFNPLNYVYIYNGAGVGTGDINNDGLPDLFFAGNEVSSKLYLNKGKMVFEDITEQAGIGTEGWSTGVSFIDINTDGLMDIYVCMAHKNPEKSKNQLYINQGNNTFKEKAADYGLNDAGYSTQAVFFDYDKDGDLDMYLLTNGMENFNHNNIRPILKNGQGKTTDRLYKNNGDNTFTNVSKEAGITIEGFGLGIGILDVNNDGWPDIYCSNDFITNDLLWVNNQDGTFTEAITKYLKQTSSNGMGMDIADFNNDGLNDIVQMDMLPESNYHNKNMTPAMNYNSQTLKYNMGYMPQYIRNTMQLANTDASFSEMGRLAGIHKTDWSWAPLFADLDNDGLKDVFISNGYGRDITDLDFMNYSEGFSNPFGVDSIRENRVFQDLKKLPPIKLVNYFYKNKGGLSFENVTKKWSEGVSSLSNGAIYVDLDLDGDLDLVTNNINEEAYIYQNKSKEKHPENTNYLSVNLNGAKLNPAGIGAHVTLYYDDSIQTASQYPARGYISSVDQVLHFGLGNRNEIDSVEVVWPDGNFETLSNIKSNRRIDLTYADATMHQKKSTDMTEKLVSNSDSLVRQIVHKESNYVDFQDHPLLLKMLSREGPGLAIADVDNDGMEDILMSTAQNDTTFIWAQERSGSFKKSMALPGSWKFEQQGGVIADFDNDGRKDIYLASGGNEFKADDDTYEDQLYLQQSNGTFLVSETLPKMNSSTATVNAVDYDKDGDLDLFVGSRLKPNSYPVAGESYILENTNGTFKDVTKNVAPEISDLGMVTAALWTDFNNDGQVDLIVVGEWMEVTFFENQKGKFKNSTARSGVAGLTGFWNSIHGADFDQDGDIDYIVGNFGENTDLKASAREPLSLVAKDFDHNGKIDPIIGYYVEGVKYPLPTRDALISQIARMKRKFPIYKTYAETTFDDLFTKEELEGSIKKEITCLTSGYLENKGDGKFEYKALPLEAQLAPVYGISISDVNDDGYADVLLSGNRSDTEILGGSMNASKGTILLGNGKGDFSNALLATSGFATSGDTRGIAQLEFKDGLGFLVANNDGALQLFRKNNSKSTIALLQNDTYALIKLSNGKTYREEGYFGSGYLTQNSRTIRIPDTATEVIIYNSQNEKRDGL